jgi:TM2 domain-containing membrane protein YozV
MTQTPQTPQPPQTPPAGAEKKLAAGICGILLGALGIHKFILGYTTAGVIMLLVSVLSLGILAWVMGIIGIIEGIIYLTKTDEQFVATYVTGKKPWF